MLRLVQIGYALLTFLLLATLFACKPQLIPQTSVADNAENRAVVDFMDRYKQAIESRSVENVLKLVSENYLDLSGPAEAIDDYNYERLKLRLEKAFERIQDIKLGIHIQHIAHKENGIEVTYFFSEHALLDFPSGEQWMSSSDVNRIVLVPRSNDLSEGFEIISGL